MWHALPPFPAFLKKPYKCIFCPHKNISSTVFNVTFIKMNGDKICVFSPRSRNSSDSCSVRLTKVSGQEARGCGIRYETVICFKHLQDKKRNDSLMCCYPLKETTNCSGQKVPCPTRLFQVFDEIGNETGTHICTKHLTIADSSSEIKSHENYVGPSSRKKVFYTRKL